MTTTDSVGSLPYDCRQLCACYDPRLLFSSHTPKPTPGLSGAGLAAKSRPPNPRNRSRQCIHIFFSQTMASTTDSAMPIKTIKIRTLVLFRFVIAPTLSCHCTPCRVMLFRMSRVDSRPYSLPSYALRRHPVVHSPTGLREISRKPRDANAARTSG